MDNFDSRRSDTHGKTTDQERLIRRQRRRPVRMANSQSNQKRREEFAIAHNPFRKKQDQEQKRFLRRSHGEVSREPVAIHTNQVIQRARSRALKAVYAKGKGQSLLKLQPSQKANTTPIDMLKPTDKPRSSNKNAKPSKKHAGSQHRAATGLKRNRTARVVARRKINA